MATARRERRDRREDLLGAAIGVFCEKGFAAASIGDIASEVGVLKGSLYHYISSKDDLLDWIFDAALQTSEARIAEVGGLEAPPVERLRAFLESQTTWYLEHVEHASVLFREFRFLEGDLRTRVTAHRRDYELFLCDLVREATDEHGSPVAIDPENVLRLVLGALEATPEWFRRGGRDSPRQVAAVYTDLSIRALTGRPVPRAS
ncbi:TetR/AcrR family transcriptional regulator [Patulibacter minatonensis]|uniref:TetR/AcrR family transcriptional regulator n=1 Tax=Patulibacter minatonensis TaxID=298163 RepID=UPI0004792F68|nr:TetR/AcrR family transcriptional regulator [Patulibacter minatonensis]